MSFMLTKVAPLLGATLDNGGCPQLPLLGGKVADGGASLSEVAAFCRQFLAAEGCPQFTNSAAFAGNYRQGYFINLGKSQHFPASLPPKSCPMLLVFRGNLLHTTSAAFSAAREFDSLRRKTSKTTLAAYHEWRRSNRLFHEGLLYHWNSCPECQPPFAPHLGEFYISDYFLLIGSTLATMVPLACHFVALLWCLVPLKYVNQTEKK